MKVPDYAHRLPEEIQPFTTKGVYDMDENVASVVQARRRPRRLASAPGPRVRHGAGRRTAIRFPTRCNRPTGPASAFCAHQSALKGGEIVRLPEFIAAGKKS